MVKMDPDFGWCQTVAISCNFTHKECHHMVQAEKNYIVFPLCLFKVFYGASYFLSLVTSKAALMSLSGLILVIKMSRFM